MKRNRRSSPQTLDVLTAFLDQPRKWRHGYDLSLETGQPSGTLYPILMRLSDRGMLESKWDEPTQPGRPPRHLYRLTAAGVAHAKAEVAHVADAHSRAHIQGSRA